MWRIPIQYRSWSAKGFGGGKERKGRRSYWTLAYSFFVLTHYVTLCQLSYMIYITNANAKINILSITAGCKEYRLFVAHNHSRVLQRSQDPLVGWGGGKIWAVDSRKNH